jgi:hypothetical protein
MVLPVTEPGFLDRFWAGFGRKATLGGIRSQTTRPWHIQNGSKSVHTATTGRFAVRPPKLKPQILPQYKISPRLFRPFPDGPKRYFRLVRCGL